MILLHLSEMISQTRIPLPGHFLINAQYVVLSVTRPSRVAKYIVSLVYVKREKQQQQPMRPVFLWLSQLSIMVTCA